jgi:hypothetical protein
MLRLVCVWLLRHQESLRLLRDNEHTHILPTSTHSDTYPCTHTHTRVTHCPTQRFNAALDRLAVAERGPIDVVLSPVHVLPTHKHGEAAGACEERRGLDA